MPLPRSHSTLCPHRARSLPHRSRISRLAHTPVRPCPHPARLARQPWPPAFLTRTGHMAWRASRPGCPAHRFRHRPSRRLVSILPRTRLHALRASAVFWSHHDATRTGSPGARRAALSRLYNPGRPPLPLRPLRLEACSLQLAAESHRVGCHTCPQGLT